MTRQDFELLLSKLDWSDQGLQEQLSFLGLYAAARIRFTPLDAATLDSVIIDKLELPAKDELFALLVQKDIGRSRQLGVIHLRNRAKRAKGANPAAFAAQHDPGTTLYPTVGFIGAFMRDVCANMESPDSFLFWSAAACISAATKRRVVFRVFGRELYTNLYVILVAPPGQARKGPPINAANRLVTTLPDINFIDRTTTERLPHDLAYRYYQQGTTLQRHDADADGFLCAEELSAFIGNEPHNRGAAQWLLDWWDSPKHRQIRTLKHGIITLRNVHITILGATTPSQLNEILPSIIASAGMLTRVILVSEGRTEKISVWGNEQSDVVDKPLIDHLAYISSREGVFECSRDGDKWMENWYRSFRGYIQGAPESEAATIERKQAHIIKLAMILALSENLELTLTGELLDRAQKIVSSLELKGPELAQAVMTPKEGRNVQRALGFIRASAPVITRTDLMRKLSPYGVKVPEFNDIIRSLVEQEMIEETMTKTSRKSSAAYRLK